MGIRARPPDRAFFFIWIVNNWTVKYKERPVCTSMNNHGIQWTPKIYVESSVISYLTAWDSTEVDILDNQVITRKWWLERDKFDLYVSPFVLAEIRAGDREAARLRMEAAKELRSLPYVQKADAVARRLTERKAVPPDTGFDAMHIAMAAIHGMDYIVSWNHKHIANPKTEHLIREVIISTGLKAPTIVKPRYFMEKKHDKS